MGQVSAAQMTIHADNPAADAGAEPGVAERVEQLYATHAPLVRSVCRSLLRDRVEAEDVVQQTFLSAQRALLNGSSPRDGAAWLATIARHESLARIRKRMREPLPVELEEDQAAPDAHFAAVRRHEAGELREALAQLPDQQREAILLREVRGLSYQEVAATLSVTTSAVESLLFRARRSLQTRLQEALAAVSVGEWVQPLRELVARLVGGGLAAPAAAKVAAVGVGTAVVAGGALVGPVERGLDRAPYPVSRSSRPPAPRVSQAAAAKAPVAPASTPELHRERTLAAIQPEREHRSGSASTSSAEVSDAQRSPGTRESERSTGGSAGTSTGTTAGGRSFGSGSTRETGDGGTTGQTSGSTEDTHTTTIDAASTSWSGSDSSSGSATAASGTTDD